MSASRCEAQEQPQGVSGVFPVDPAERGTTMTYALHDAKNMACALLADLEWLRDRLELESLAEVSLSLDDMSQACRSLSELLLAALRSARTGQHSLVLRTSPTVLADVVARSLRGIRRRAGLAQVELAVSLDARLVLDLDAELVRRVVDNLLDNALAVSPPGATITVHLGQYGDHAVLSISDEGPGISPERQALIFEMFTAGADSRGAGVGLAFCRQVAEDHGGALTVDSVPGDGATFVLSLPFPSTGREP
jgi:signal transduction histidine kinase